MRVAAVAYFVPFMFVYEPSLLMLKGWDEWDRTALAFSSAVIGCVCLAGGLHGYLALLLAQRLWRGA